MYEVAADGSALTFSLAGYDGQYVSAADQSEAALSCMSLQLDTPDSVISKIEGTRGVDGVRTAEGHGLTYEWTFDDASGLDLTVTG